MTKSVWNKLFCFGHIWNVKSTKDVCFPIYITSGASSDWLKHHVLSEPGKSEDEVWIMYLVGLPRTTCIGRYVVRWWIDTRPTDRRPICRSGLSTGSRPPAHRIYRSSIHRCRPIYMISLVAHRSTIGPVSVDSVERESTASPLILSAFNRWTSNEHRYSTLLPSTDKRSIYRPVLDRHAARKRARLDL